jgi:hypothetical protein
VENIALPVSKVCEEFLLDIFMKKDSMRFIGQYSLQNPHYKYKRGFVLLLVTGASWQAKSS